MMFALPAACLVIAGMLDIHMSFGFSAGLIGYVLFFNAPVAKNAWMLIPLGLAFAAVYYALLYFSIRFFNIKVMGREDDETTATTGVNADSSELAKAVLHGKCNKRNLQ